MLRSMQGNVEKYRSSNNTYLTYREAGVTDDNIPTESEKQQKGIQKYACIAS